MKKLLLLLGLLVLWPLSAYAQLGNVTMKVYGSDPTGFSCNRTTVAKFGVNLYVCDNTGHFALAATSSAGATAFSAITSGTSTASLVIGPGGSLTTSGGGSIVFSSGPFSGLTGKPTTLSGYGITDGVTNTTTVNAKPLSSNITLGWTDFSFTAANIIGLWSGTCDASHFLSGAGTCLAGSQVYPLGTGIVTVSGGTAWGTTLTAPTGALVGTTDTQTLSGKSMSGSSNTFTNIPNSALTNTAATVNSQTCTLGSTCIIPFQTNGSGNFSQAGINLLTSTGNAVGLTVTPTNSGTNQEKFEISGIITPFGGGSGLSNPTAHSIFVAEGASNYNLITSPSTNGYYLCGFNVTGGIPVDPACNLAGVPVTANSGSYSMLYSDRASFQKISGGSTSTLTLGQITGNFASNYPFVVGNFDSGNVTLQANAADKIDNGSTGGTQTVIPGWAAFVYQDSSSAPGNWWTVRVPMYTAFNGGVNCGDATHAMNFISGVIGCQSITATAAAGGSNTQLQYNNSTALGGILQWTTNGTTTITAGATGVLDLSSMAPASGLKIPGVAGAAPTADGFIGTDLTSHEFVYGSNGSTRTAANLAGTQTFTNKSMSGSSNTFTNIPISTAISGLGTGVATLLAGASSGTGGPAGTTSPSFTTPTLGVASATSINKVALTAPATGSTLTIADGKTLTVSNSITVAGTDSTTMTFPSSSATISYTVANGTSALGTGAISSATCATVVTTSATGTATTDSIDWGFNGDPTGVTGYTAATTGGLFIVAYPTANNVNFKVCNPTSSSITPGAVTLNWRVVR